MTTLTPTSKNCKNLNSCSPVAPGSPESLRTLELLECSVCCDYMQIPIYQCKEGHTLCNDCKAKIRSCPTCRSEDVDIRCRVLERMAESLHEVNCRFASYGCSSRLKYTEKNEHELKCIHRPFECLHVSDGCSFEGSADELVSHLVYVHHYRQYRTNEINFVCTHQNMMKFCDDVEHYLWQACIYSCYEKHFVLRVHRAQANKADTDAQFFISVAVLHTKHHPNRYVVCTNGNHREYTFEGPVWTIRKGFKEIERVRDCLILPENTAFFLSGGKGSENDVNIVNLSIKGQIYPPAN
eukprot:Platyproteum_vivax@DN3217_c0_g1_i1.p1